MRLNIKSKVDEKGFNKHQFSMLIQLGYTATCNLYDGKTERIYFETLERICKVLDCTPNDIIVSDDPYLDQKIKSAQTKSDTSK